VTVSLGMALAEFAENPWRRATELPLRRAVAPLSEGGCREGYLGFKLLFDKANWSVEWKGPRGTFGPLSTPSTRVLIWPPNRWEIS
jgi:hypothetical protein